MVRSSPTNAPRRRQPVRQALRAWSRRHAYSLLSSLGSLLRQPLASAMTIIVLAIALSLPVLLHSSLKNFQQIGQDWQRLDTLTVFLADGTGQDEAEELAARIAGWEAVETVSEVTPDQALEELREEAGFAEAVEALSENPLPWVLEVTPGGLSEAQLNQLVRRMEGLDPVEMVLVDLRWLNRLENMLEVLDTVIWLLAGLFALAIVFVVGNTIRLDINNRKEEIEVMALVGATDSFIRRPFLYAGLWFGLAGGLLAWLMVLGSLAFLRAPVARLAASYDSPFRLLPPDTTAVAVLIAGASLLGLAGAWVAVTRHLRHFSPA